MAGFGLELPDDLVSNLKMITENTDEMFGRMTKAGADVVYKEVMNNMKSSFKSTKSLEKGLRITKTYKTKSDDGINTKVGFYGYNDKKIPIPLIALAREYGTSRGEKKKPFFRKAFNNTTAIENAMLKVQEEYIDEE